MRERVKIFIEMDMEEVTATNEEIEEMIVKSLVGSTKYAQVASSYGIRVYFNKDKDVSNSTKG